MPRTPAVALAPGMWRVPLLRDYINGFVLRDDAGRVTLIDMGLPRARAEAAGRAGLDRLLPRLT